MSKLDLLGGDDADTANGLSLRVNESYAKRYDERKRKQELSQLEDKYKEKLKKKGILAVIDRKGSKAREEGTATATATESESDYTDSESDVEEDEMGEQLTPAVDAQILKTLAAIRSRSERVYDPKVDFFDAEEVQRLETEWKAKHKEPKHLESLNVKQVMTLKDYHRERLLSGRGGDSEAEEEPLASEPVPMSHVEEQELLKAEMKKAFDLDNEEPTGNGTDDNLNDGFFKRRQRTDEEIAKEESEYRDFLLENLAASSNAKESMLDWLSYREELTSGPQTHSKRPRLTGDDAFLVDYVLNRGWVDKRQSRVPSYDQVVVDDSEDEEAETRAEEFEAAHNFRYEQEGGTQIQTFARVVEGSVRRPEESRRKKQRESAVERKAAEKLQKTEELKRLKNLKMREIKEKMARLERYAGVAVRDQDALMEELSRDEFDPEAHDRLMATLIGDEDEEVDAKKPQFSSDSELDGELETEIQKAKGVRKAFKALKKVSVAESSDPSEAKLQVSKYLDELYQLDYEDLIAGEIPCRFKYQRVEPSAYGLKVEDILAAKDADLNKHVSLKKLAPYRPADVQRKEIKKFGSKHRVHLFRKALGEDQNSHNKHRNKGQDKDKGKDRD